MKTKIIFTYILFIIVKLSFGQADRSHRIYSNWFIYTSDKQDFVASSGLWATITHLDADLGLKLRNTTSEEKSFSNYNINIDKNTDYQITFDYKSNNNDFIFEWANCRIRLGATYNYVKAYSNNEFQFKEDVTIYSYSTNKVEINKLGDTYYIYVNDVFINSFPAEYSVYSIKFIVDCYGKININNIDIYVFKEEKPKIHFILFTDTHDSKVGSACIETNKYFKYTFVPNLERHTGMVVKTYYCSGNDFNISKLNTIINNLNTTDKDVIFFYYSGHGYNKGSSYYPTLTVGSIYDTKNLETIYYSLKNKQHRLLVVMAEACNKVHLSRNEIRSGNITLNYGYDDANSTHYKELFVYASGNYIMSSSKKGQLSHLVSGQPGYFTCGFRDAFSKYTNSDYSGYSTWDKVLNETKAKTSNYAKQNGDIQTPQWYKESN